jgi:hypothetical protein
LNGNRERNYQREQQAGQAFPHRLEFTASIGRRATAAVSLHSGLIGAFLAAS